MGAGRRCAALARRCSRCRIPPAPAPRAGVPPSDIGSRLSVSQAHYLAHRSGITLQHRKGCIRSRGHPRRPRHRCPPTPANRRAARRHTASARVRFLTDESPGVDLGTRCDLSYSRGKSVCSCVCSRAELHDRGGPKQGRSTGAAAACGAGQSALSNCKQARLACGPLARPKTLHQAARWAA
jgi:hypothetical protein